MRDRVREQLGEILHPFFAALLPELLNALPDRFEMIGIRAQIRQALAQADHQDLHAYLDDKPVKGRAFRWAAMLIVEHLLETGLVVECLRRLSDDVLERAIKAGEKYNK